MKIGTISLNINAPDFNYGAILHSWAFQRYLMKEHLADSVEIIDYITPKLENYNMKYPFFGYIKAGQLKRVIRSSKRAWNYRKRYNKFRSFINSSMIISDKQYTQKSLDSAKLDYDTVICESDVIWSAVFFNGKFDKSFFLASDSMKGMNRIAYAASMGDGDLCGREEEFHELLKSPYYISCRESYEKAIIEKYTDKKAEHVLDPVLLLRAGDYEKITAGRMCNDKYVLIYMPVDNNEKLAETALNYARKRGCRVIEINTKLKRNPNKDVITDMTAGIEEFLSYIKYSEAVFTNSFHAICFAVIFRRQFYAFSRRYAGKVKDICECLGLSERYITDEFKEKEQINYEDVERAVNGRLETSATWLKNAIERK